LAALWSVIPNSGYRFSEEIMLHDHAPGLRIGGQFVMRAVHRGRKLPKSDVVIQRRRAARLRAALAITISLVSLGAIDPAFAQFRGGDIRPMSVGPRPPSSFGGSAFGNVGRVDPGLRLMPNDGGAVVSTSPNNPSPTIGNFTSRSSRSVANGVPPANERRYVTDEVLILLNGNPSSAVVDTFTRRHRLTRMESQYFPSLGATLYRWHIPNGRSVTAVTTELATDHGIGWSQPNYIYSLQQSVAGEGAEKTQSEGDIAQYALAKLHLSEAHGLAKGDQVLVAVIDSGIDPTHPELQGVVADQFDALQSSEGPHVHGTGIAGIIAAHGRLVGAAPAVHILAVRAFGLASSGAEGTTFNIIKGLDWATSKGARIVNMSFAGPSDPLMARTMASARQKGAILIAAAGNAGPKSPPLFPAADPNVIAVTATDADDRLFPMANRGAYVAVAAPGVDILVPVPGGSYQVSSGTSFAAAYVSGVVALILERRPRLLPDAAKRILLSTAKDLGPKGRDDQFGAGLIDAYQAIMSLEPKATANSGAAVR
jgi:subtilisin family serine protease